MILKVPVSGDEPLIQTHVVSAFVWEEVESTKVTLMALESVTGQFVLAAKLGIDSEGSNSQSGSAWFTLPTRC